MSHTFTPPMRTFAPRVNPDTPDWQQKPAIFFKADIPIGVNVWWWTDNTISEVQPPAWLEWTSGGTIIRGVKKVWYGGRTHQISDSEFDILTGAGYAANLT